MATTQVIVVKGHTIEWRVNDSTGVVAATANMYWDSTAGGVGGTDPDQYWIVKKVIFIPSTAQTTGGFARIYDGGGTTGYPELVRFNMMINESDVQTYDWGEDGYRCQPVYPSTLQNALTTGAKFIWHLK